MALKREDIFVGARLQDHSRFEKPKLIVTEITPMGFKYTWCKRWNLGARYGWSDRGEMTDINLPNLEFDGDGQRQH